MRSSSAASQSVCRPPPLRPAQPMRCGIAVVARLDVVHQPHQVPGPHAGERLPQRDRRVIERGAGGLHERVFVVHLPHRFAALAKGAGVGRQDDQPSLGEVLRVSAVVAVQGVGHGRNVPASGRHVLAAAAVAVRRDDHGPSLAGLQVVRQQDVEGHDHVRLGMDLHSLPHVAVARYRFSDDGLGIGEPHAGYARNGA